MWARLTVRVSMRVSTQARFRAACSPSGARSFSTLRRHRRCLGMPYAVRPTGRTHDSSDLSLCAYERPSIRERFSQSDFLLSRSINLTGTLQVRPPLLPPLSPALFSLFSAPFSTPFPPPSCFVRCQSTELAQGILGAAAVQ